MELWHRRHTEHAWRGPIRVRDAAEIDGWVRLLAEWGVDWIELRQGRRVMRRWWTRR